MSNINNADVLRAGNKFAVNGRRENTGSSNLIRREKWFAWPNPISINHPNHNLNEGFMRTTSSPDFYGVTSNCSFDRSFFFRPKDSFERFWYQKTGNCDSLQTTLRPYEEKKSSRCVVESEMYSIAPFCLHSKKREKWLELRFVLLEICCAISIKFLKIFVLVGERHTK